MKIRAIDCDEFTKKGWAYGTRLVHALCWLTIYILLEVQSTQKSLSVVMWEFTGYLSPLALMIMWHGITQNHWPPDDMMISPKTDNEACIITIVFVFRLTAAACDISFLFMEDFYVREINSSVFVAQMSENSWQS